jgi:drug/metabolite transporter (DMT)-like permease
MWGGSFVGVKLVVHSYPSSFGALLRVGLALVALSLYSLFQRKKLGLPAPVRHRLWLAGLFSQGVPFALLFWGERRISPGLAGIINATVPLWTFVLSLVTPSAESVNPRKILGILFGFIGVAFICSPLITLKGTHSEAWGAAAVFLMAICYGIGNLMTRTLFSGSSHNDLLTNAFHQTASAFVFLMCWSFSTETWPSLSMLLSTPTAMMAAIYLGVCSTALAFLIYFHLIREWGAVRASAVTYVAPIFALVWDYLFFRTIPRFNELIGIAVVFSGVLLLQTPRGRDSLGRE